MRLKIETFSRTRGWDTYELYLRSEGVIEIQTEHIESVGKLKDYTYYESIQVPVLRDRLFRKPVEELSHEKLEIGVVDIWKVTMISGAEYFTKIDPFKEVSDGMVKV